MRLAVNCGARNAHANHMCMLFDLNAKEGLGGESGDKKKMRREDCNATRELNH